MSAADTEADPPPDPAAAAKAAGPDPTSLTFLDLLYAIPLADLATRVSRTELKGIPAEGWTEIALVMAVLTFGWIGHHNNRHRQSERKPAGDFDFRSWRFVQFLFEVLIIVAYFALANHLALTAPAGHHHANANWQFAWLPVIFVLYLIWDTLDVKNAKDSAWKQQARTGRNVTFGALVVLIVGLWLVHDVIQPKSAAAIAIADGLAIALMYAYRAVQELCHQTP
jgi:hypothetical protein